jgi:hypothetical protein
MLIQEKVWSDYGLPSSILLLLPKIYLIDIFIIEISSFQTM